MINSYDFEDAEQLRASVERGPAAAWSTSSRRAQEQDLKVIYVNDNHGAWHHGRAEMVEEVLAGELPRARRARSPRATTSTSSSRHATRSSTRLRWSTCCARAAIDHIVLIGQVTEQCILYSALDAYIRHFEVHVPPDAVAHIHEDLAERR